MKSNLSIKIVRRVLIPCGLLATLGLLPGLGGPPDVQAAAADDARHTIDRGEFSLWTSCEGSLQAERRASLYSRISQPTAILQLAPEGSYVEAGDLVASLDRSSLDQSLVNLERDHALATAELETLLKAEIPFERVTAANDLDALRYDRQKQGRVVENTLALHGDGLVSDQELEGQQMLLANLDRQVAFAENRQETLRTIVHPAREAKARAQLDATLRQLELLREQAEGARLTAPFAGMVIYLPLHLDGEFRNVREGDTVYRNQKIIQVADMESLLVQCLVPEAGISLVRPGCSAVVTPTAFPDLRLHGTVDTIGSVAMSVSGRPAWQKFFNVVIRLEASDERLRSSMSVYVQVLSRHDPSALVIPRGLVAWDRGQPWCRVIEAGSPRRRDLVLGSGNDTHFLIEGGLAEGDSVVPPDAWP